MNSYFYKLIFPIFLSVNTFAAPMISNDQGCLRVLQLVDDKLGIDISLEELNFLIRRSEVTVKASDHKLRRNRDSGFTIAQTDGLTTIISENRNLVVNLPNSIDTHNPERLPLKAPVHLQDYGPLPLEHAIKRQTANLDGIQFKKLSGEGKIRKLFSSIKDSTQIGELSKPDFTEDTVFDSKEQPQVDRSETIGFGCAMASCLYMGYDLLNMVPTQSFPGWGFWAGIGAAYVSAKFIPKLFAPRGTPVLVRNEDYDFDTFIQLTHEYMTTPTEGTPYLQVGIPHSAGKRNLSLIYTHDKNDEPALYLLDQPRYYHPSSSRSSRSRGPGMGDMMGTGMMGGMDGNFTTPL